MQISGGAIVGTRRQSAEAAWPGMAHLCDTWRVANSETNAAAQEKTGFVRSMLLVIFLLGSIGTGIELLLLGHTEELWQLTPLTLITISVTIALMWFITGERRILRVFQLSMLLWLLAGPLGIILHYRANVAVERELDPQARGVPLMREALRGTMPALAPGTMFQLGLVGLLYTYRHPEVGAASRSTAKEASGQPPVSGVGQDPS